MTKRLMGWSLAAAALALAATSGFACDHDAKAADAKDVKKQDATAVAKASDTKDAGMPCCAGAKGTEAKGCPKKKTAAPAVAAQAAPAKGETPPEPAPGAGTKR
jgi:hypothetical protein